MILLVLAAPIAFSAQDSTPQTLRVQGFLSDKAGGTAVPANGIFAMTFDLYDAEVGGTRLATAALPSVEVIEGFYEVDLPFPGPAFAGTPRFLEITIAGETLAPRVRLGSVPYAFVADRIYGLEGQDLEESAEIATGIAAHAASPDAHREHASLEESAEIDGKVAIHAGATDPHPAYVRKSGGTMNGTLTLSPAAGDALIATAGRVGIGTATPGAALDVAGGVLALAFGGPGGIRYAERPFDVEAPEGVRVNLTLTWNDPFPDASYVPVCSHRYDLPATLPFVSPFIYGMDAASITLAFLGTGAQGGYSGTAYCLAVPPATILGSTAAPPGAGAARSRKGFDPGN